MQNYYRNDLIISKPILYRCNDKIIHYFDLYISTKLLIANFFGSFNNMQSLSWKIWEMFFLFSSSITFNMIASGKWPCIIVLTNADS